MNIVTKVSEWQSIRKNLSGEIGFVPTMGHLHAGHFALCEQSQRENNVTVVSIFINPKQFDRQEDFITYPKNLLSDEKNLAQRNIDYLFVPSAEELYADDYTFQIQETKLSHLLEGEFRPGHFNGVLTIVLKLLNLIAPKRAYFGEKDYQQLLLIRKMVDAFFMPVHIISHPTMRDSNGLALSSRNTRLTPEQKEHAAHLHYLLKNENDIDLVIEKLSALGFVIEYVTDRWQRRLAAVWFQNVRLIDNVAINTL